MYERSRARASVLLTAAALSGCSVDVSLEGKLCPCSSGYYCNTEGRCEWAGTNCPAVPETVAGGLAVGEHHNCAIRDGALWCWGNNASGQLGLGDTSQRAFAVRVGTDDDWQYVSAGTTHTCGIRRRSDGFGALHCWGSNDAGQLGFGDYTGRSVPQLVTENTSFASVSAGNEHSCAIAANGQLWCWGRQAGGALGTDVVQPERVPAPVQVGVLPYDALDAGLGHNCAVSRTGGLWCWGHNECWQTGFLTHQLAPRRVDDGCWSSVTAGMRHSCAIDAAGTARCFGDNSSAQLGLGFADGGEATSTECSAFESLERVALESGVENRWRKLSAGKLHTCGIDDQDRLWCWGFNEQHQTSDSSELYEGSPVRRGESSDWIDVGAGFFHTCALDRAGVIQCVGENSFGEQGTGANNAVLTRVGFGSTSP